MLEKGWIKANIFFYGISIFFVQKKSGKLRMYIEFCALNTNIKLDDISLPHGLYFHDKLSKSKYFSSINLVTA